MTIFFTNFRRTLLAVCLLFSSIVVFSQGDFCYSALTLTNVSSYCSITPKYTNVGSTASGLAVASCWAAGATSDVWFSFTATGTDVLLSVNGSGFGGTIVRPRIALYNGTCNATSTTVNQLGCNNGTAGSGFSQLYVGGLILGQTYLIRISSTAANVGTFELCVNNYNPPPSASADCAGAGKLCNKDPLSVGTLSGGGLNPNEPDADANSCMVGSLFSDAETNSVWYTWTCGTSGTLLFDINPLDPVNDIDYVLYQLSSTDPCGGRTVIRCNTSSCLNATGSTGLNATDVDISEDSNCDPGENSYCQQINMVAGTSYALLINNADANSGFNIVWGGTGTFSGPDANIVASTTTICAGESVTFNGSTSTNYSGLNWSFNPLVSPVTTTTGVGPHTITFPNTGTYVAILQATSALGCTTVEYENIIVGSAATISVTSASICPGTSTVLTASGASSYTWSTGATTSTISVSPSSAASYTVIGGVGTCTNTQIVSVSINSLPSVSAGTDQTLGCGSASVVTLSGSAITPTNATASWSGPSISGSPTSYTTTVTGAGTYTLTGTNPVNGCTSTSTVLVNPSAGAPPVTINPITNTITCTNTLVSVSISSTVSPASYTWSGSGIVSGNGTASITVNQGGTFNFTLTNTTNSCTTSSNTVVVQNTIVPTTTAITAGVLTCSTATVALNSILAGMNYTWTAPTGGSVGSANTQSTTASGIAGIFTVNIVNPANGCSYTTTTSVTQNTTIPTTTASVTGILTCTTSTVTLNSTLSGMNYTWTAPSGGSVSSANAQSTTASSVAGAYSLTVIDPSNGCSYTTNASVTQNTTTPAGLIAGSNQTLTCTSTSVTLNGSITTPTNAVISWAGAGVCGSTSSLASSACTAGVYTLSATDAANGCVSTSTVEIFPNAGAPTATITSTALVLDCNNASQTVSVTSTPNTNVTYSWNNTPSTVSANGSIATFTNSNTYICTITNTISNCSVAVQAVVTTNTTIPTISISNTQTLTCANPTAVISTTTAPSSGITYTWSGSLVSGQGTGAVTVNAAGNYSVVILDAANGCTNTVSSQIDADTNVPSASIVASSSNSLITCQNPTVTLTASATPAAVYSYTWNPSGNTNAVENVTNANVYSVLVLNAATGCTATAQYTVSGNTTPPSVIVTNTTMPCGSPSVTIGAASTATNVSYGWTALGSGTILSGANTFTSVVGSAGQYEVLVTDNTNGCTNTGTVTVTSIAVTAAFTANPLTGAAPLLVNFTNQSTGTLNSWTFGDSNNNTSTSTNPNHTYNATGIYVVTLVSTDATGLCSATATISIEVIENTTIIIPNVFTPNGDGKNDVFKIATTGMKDLTCDIFNRWGTKLYTIAGINDGWDGGNSTDGTYFFMLKGTGLDGKEYIKQGSVNLFK